MILNAIRFFSSLIANVATILINFTPKFALVKSFQHFALKFLKKDFSQVKESASKSLLSWPGKCDVFLLELYLAIDPSNLAIENDVTELSELQMHVQK